MTNRPWYEVALFALPLVGFLAGVAKAEIARIGAPRYEFAIEGYDPRDLVRGNYLLYRFVHTGAEGSLNGEYVPVDVACVTPSTTKPSQKQITLHGFGTKSPGCLTTLPVSFVEEPHRFYIQADKGPDLEAALRSGRASVVVVHPPGSDPVVEKLLIDGKPASEVRPSDDGDSSF